MNNRIAGLLSTVGVMLTLAACASGIAPIQPIADAGGGTRLPLRNEVVSAVTLVADGAADEGLYAGPIDASPSPDGATIYFTALGAQTPGLFGVAATGGEVRSLAQGVPLVMPLGLAVSTDGRTVFVADSAAASDQSMAGQVFAVDASGGELEPLAATAGTGARALTVVQENGVDVLYFSGVDPSDGQPAVMRLADDGMLTVVAKGAPLVEPGGLAVATDGILYVADRLAAGDGLGSIFRIADGTIDTLAERVRLGNPVGLALTTDDALLLASALNPATGRAQVLLIDLASGQQAIINRVIEANSGSGGVHRAANTNVFAWADFRGGRGGQGNEGGVYVINP